MGVWHAKTLVDILLLFLRWITSNIAYNTGTSSVLILLAGGSALDPSLAVIVLQHLTALLETFEGNYHAVKALSVAPIGLHYSIRGNNRNALKRQWTLIYIYVIPV